MGRRICLFDKILESLKKVKDELLLSHPPMTQQAVRPPLPIPNHQHAGQLVGSFVSF
jgi:hypothetical protein